MNIPSEIFVNLVFGRRFSRSGERATFELAYLGSGGGQVPLFYETTNKCGIVRVNRREIAMSLYCDCGDPYMRLELWNLSPRSLVAVADYKGHFSPTMWKRTIRDEQECSTILTEWVQNNLDSDIRSFLSVWVTAAIVPPDSPTVRVEDLFLYPESCTFAACVTNPDIAWQRPVLYHPSLKPLVSQAVWSNAPSRDEAILTRSSVLNDDIWRESTLPFSGGPFKTVDCGPPSPVKDPDWENTEREWRDAPPAPYGRVVAVLAQSITWQGLTAYRISGGGRQWLNSCFDVSNTRVDVRPIPVIRDYSGSFASCTSYGEIYPDLTCGPNYTWGPIVGPYAGYAGDIGSRGSVNWGTMGLPPFGGSTLIGSTGFYCAPSMAGVQYIRNQVSDNETIVRVIPYSVQAAIEYYGVNQNGSRTFLSRTQYGGSTPPVPNVDEGQETRCYKVELTLEAGTKLGIPTPNGKYTIDLTVDLVTQTIGTFCVTRPPGPVAVWDWAVERTADTVNIIINDAIDAAAATIPVANVLTQLLDANISITPI